MPNQQKIKKRLYAFYDLNKEKGDRFIKNHFLAEGYNLKTISRFIKDAKNNVPLGRKKGRGKKPTVNTPINRERVRRLFDHKKGISQHRAASKLNCSTRSIGRMLQTLKKPIRCFKQTKKTKRTLLQKALARPKCRRLYMKYHQHEFVMDDESYFTLSNSVLTENNTYYSSDCLLTPSDVVNWEKAKFEEKILLWIIFSSKGIGQVYIAQSKQAINKYIYLDKCIKKRLVPFINKYYRGDQYVFWPDLASLHYANSVQIWLEENNINFLAKSDNPANLPEVSPIENVFVIIKRDVYRDGWSVSSIKQYKQRICLTMRKLPSDCVQNLMTSTIQRLDQVRQNGIA